MPAPRLPGVELVNDAPDNDCFACGPRNPVGLRLRFFDDGRVVRSPLRLDARYGGSPRHVLQGILYAAMDDVVWWTAYRRFGELGEMSDRVVAEWPGAVEVDRGFVVEARVLRRGRVWWTFEGRCVQDGTVKARLVQRLRRPTTRALDAWLASPGVPASTREDLREALARRRRARGGRS